VNSIAVCLEQGGNGLFELNDVKGFLDQLNHKINHFYARNMADEVSVFTLGLQWNPPLLVQIVTLDRAFSAFS
jgi:hypothetical protein